MGPSNYAAELQCVETKIVSVSTCNERAHYNGKILKGMFCAGELGVGGKDACQGNLINIHSRDSEPIFLLKYDRILVENYETRDHETFVKNPMPWIFIPRQFSENYFSGKIT